MNACCVATRSRWTTSTRSICVLARTFLTLYYTIEFNKSNIERSLLFIQYASHITGSGSTGGSFDLPTQFTINTAISQPHMCGDGLACDEPFSEVSVSLHSSVITQDGYSALMMAARDGRTEVVSLLLEAGANIHLQNEVKCQLMCTRRCDSTVLL